jgi:phosphate transport system substrate-binding protein
MKSTTLFLIISLLAVNQLFGQKLRIKGSDTVFPLTQMLAEEFMKRNIDASILISGGGSGTGISALLNGTTDIAQSARELTADEKLNLNKEGIPVTETIIAFDALAVIVNPENKVTQLTVQQLEAIFTGAVTNWKDVGGIDMDIVVYSRQNSSGTYNFFKDHELSGKNFTASAILMPATGAIAQSVSQVKGAIGYVGLAYLDRTLKPIAISSDKGKTYIAPSVETVKDKSYPIARPLYYIFPDNLKDAISPFIGFVLSNAGQQIVLKAGYVPVR